MPRPQPENMEAYALEQFLKRKEIMRRNYEKNAEKRKEYRRNKYALQKQQGEVALSKDVKV
jgi:hypothetical protein